MIALSFILDEGLGSASLENFAFERNLEANKFIRELNGGFTGRS